MDYSYPTTMYECIFAQMYNFWYHLNVFIFTKKIVFSQHCKKIFSTRNIYIHLGEHTLIHYSQTSEL